jgi:hypothetical protein
VEPIEIDDMPDTASLFRSVNDRIRELPDSFGEYDFVCECADAHCSRWMRMTGDEYRSLRSDPQQFAVVPGHEELSLEDVLAREVHYVVVRKH